MWQSLIMEKFPTIEMKKNALLKDYTYTKTGGRAEVLVFPTSKEDLQKVLVWANEQDLPLTILGNASNVIVTDGGIKGIVVMLEKLNKIVVNEQTIQVESGIKLVDLSAFAAEQGLSGLEFACGIPGSVGGAVFMNAGAYGGEMKDVIVSVQVLTRQGEFKTYSNQEMAFAYRQSLVQETGDIVLETSLTLVPGLISEIQEKMKELNRLRSEKQPLEYPSCGSVFKRPEGYFAGKLIQDAGLQGTRIGGVEVSKKHAGFMVNVADGTAQDYKDLIAHVQKVVKEKFAVDLETEVKFIGE